jgi:hypothetical protein
MALVTYVPIPSGSTPDPMDVYRYFYTWGGDSFEQINGRLSADNIRIDPNAKLDYKSLQQRATSHGKTVAGTANLDFFGTHYLGRGFFNGVSTLPTVAFPDNFTHTGEPWSNNRWHPITGGSVQFYLPYKSWVLLTWQVAWTNDSANVRRLSRIRLFIDGKKDGHNLNTTAPGVAPPTPPPSQEYSGMERCVRRTMWGEGTDDVPGPFLKDRQKSRHWCGHFFVEDGLTQGFHSASLRILADDQIKQTRVRARNMKYIHFAHKDS